MSPNEEPKPRKKNLYKALLPVNAVPCRYCPGRIVYVQLDSGSRMPLSWATRTEVRNEAGAMIGFTMEPHFADCPNWPGRSKKPKAT